jgi:hypothetical protein
MTVNYTTNLSLGQPVTGTESGTWGDDVNNAVTSYLDIAIAGGLAVTVTTADVTLTLTQGTSSATNIGSTTAQYAILNVSGAMTAARNLILPSSSRQYVINNACTGGFLLTVKGSATTGVTLVNGEKAHVFWNGSDYVKVSNSQGGAGSFTTLSATGVATFSAGTALLPAITTSGDTNTGIWFPAADTIAFTEGGAESMRIDSSGNVGIGVAPTSKLHVSGGRTDLVANSETYALGVRYAVGTGIYYIGASNSATPDLVFSQTGGSERMRITDAGNVGIGTSSPGNKFAVLSADNTEATGIASFTANNGSQAVQIGYNWVGGADASQPLRFLLNATERMRIDSSGNVGIGTSAPLSSAKQTNQYDGGGTVSQALALVGYGGVPTTLCRTAGGTAASPSATATATINLIGSTTNDGTTFFNTSQIISNVDTTCSAGSHPTNISFSTTPSGSTSRVSRMNIASTGIITMSAYGVGTATFSATGVISSVSDETWKIKDGVPTDPDAMLKKLEPGYWYYNDEKKESYGSDRQLGFYAQNVNAAIGPEAAPEPTTSTNVDSDGNETTTTRPWGYYDRSVLAITVMSLQKALATIEFLTARITALESKEIS